MLRVRVTVLVAATSKGGHIAGTKLHHRSVVRHYVLVLKLQELCWALATKRKRKEII